MSVGFFFIDAAFGEDLPGPHGIKSIAAVIRHCQGFGGHLISAFMRFKQQPCTANVQVKAYGLMFEVGERSAV